METYLEDFSADGTILVKGGSKLEELINNRQAKFNLTTEYKEINDKIEDLLNKLKDLPEVRELARELEDEITSLECANYSTAYRDGITDLMAALTFNKLNITSVEYYKVS